MCPIVQEAIELMGTHPHWCTGEERVEDDHLSATVDAARAEDLVGIRLRLAQPGNETRLTFFEVEFADDGEVRTYVLPTGQARMLADTIRRFLDLCLSEPPK